MINTIELYHGDCLEEMAKLPDGCVDMVMCDLPYGTTQNKWDTCIDLPALWKQYKRICRGAIVLTAAQPFTSALVMSNPSRFKHEWIWEKTAATGFLNASSAPLKAHESVLVFSYTRLTYNPIKTDGHRIKRCAGSTSHGDNYGIKSGYKAYDSSERYPRSVQVFPKDNRLIAPHPTQKPVALMEYLIRTYTNDGMTVLDNCMGSGTTGVACNNLGRNFIGIEKDTHYFKIAKRRIASETPAQLTSQAEFLFQ